MLNSINSLVNFVQIWQKVISLVTMATNVDNKLLTIVFLFLSGTDHSVKVSSNSESVRALLDSFGGYRELMLNVLQSINMQQLPSSSLCQKCRISMVFSSQEAVEASMVNTYFTDKRDIRQAVWSLS